MKFTINCDKTDIMYMDELAERVAEFLDLESLEPTNIETVWCGVQDGKPVRINLEMNTIEVDGGDPMEYFGYDDCDYISLQDYLDAVTLVWGKDENGKTAIYWEY